ncbi:hypothetical protein [Tianweitania sediminis]|uniref:Uncharacterized protein n=1 Tax=Tianweitania sediminis TaxID=1502156 RepID=A0A8J7RLV4_9HYPH|nr:hypothetical protein [Tianweitania sediminis]MBP0439566.1 hypothetical protein [Tianweitania sediminis]
MPQWMIDLLDRSGAVTAIVTVVGTAIVSPLLIFLGKVLFRASPPPPPVAHDVRDLPDHPLLVSAKVHLQDEEVAILVALKAQLDRIEHDLDRIHGRIDLLMRK